MKFLIILPSLLALLFPLAVSAQESDSAMLKLVKDKAQAMVTATLKGDYEEVVKATYGPALETLGGSDGALETIKQQMDQMKASGMKIVKFDLGDPKKIFSTPEMAFVILPTSTEMSIPQATVNAKSYLLGLSSDQGKSWKFVDGSGLASKPEWLPKLPEGFELPKLSNPIVTPK